MSPRHLLIVLIFTSLVLNTIGIVRWNAGAPYDTAHKGIEAIEEVLQGNFAPFYRHYNGQPPLLDWLLAIVFLLAGVSPLTLHLPGILTGVLTTLLFYLVGKALWSPRAGLYASLFGTTSHWVLLEMREGTHNIQLIPLLLTIIWCVAIVYRAPRVGHRYAAAMLGGVCMGAIAYVYAPGWIFLGVFASVFPVLIVASLLGHRWIKQRLPLLLMIILATLIWLPFIQYTRDDPRSVLIHADDEMRTRDPGQLMMRMARNLVPVSSAFTYLPIPPFSNHEGNTTLYLAGIALPFPVPFVSPVGAVLLLASLAMIVRGWYYRKPMVLPAVLAGLLIVAVVPNLLTTGPQPHYRRTIAAAAPLFLLMGWGAALLHQSMARQSRTKQRVWYTVIIGAALYGPALYFGVVLPSQWFAETYQTKHDRVAPVLFARVAAGQRVTLAGNTAHMKPFQFYALATPQAQRAFRILNLHTEMPFPEATLQETDVLIYVQAGCEGLLLPDFLPEPLVLRSEFGIAACVFDRPGITPALREARVDLPSSGPLLPAYLKSTPPLEPHPPFHGTIYGI